jgi:hypothetical protein
MPTGVLIAPDRHAANVVDDALSKARLAREPVWNSCGWDSNSTMTQSLVSQLLSH